MVLITISRKELIRVIDFCLCEGFLEATDTKKRFDGKAIAIFENFIHERPLDEGWENL